MYRHWWYTVDNGMGIECDKCGKYANIQIHEDFTEIERAEDCPIKDDKSRIR